MSTVTRHALIAEAERLMRLCGYAAFSYADLAAKIGITKASIHYHFPTKERLAEALVDDAMQRFSAALEAITAGEQQAMARLRRYSTLFVDGFDEGLRPLCGALSHELGALPDSLRQRTHAYFTRHLAWLEAIIGEGQRQGELNAAPAPATTAQALLGALEGGSVVARALADKQLFFSGFEQLLGRLERHRDEPAARQA